MYVGTEVSVGKWVVTFMERDAHILASLGLSSAELQGLAQTSPDVLSKFFENDPRGFAVAGYALSTLTLFALALLGGRLVSSFLLGIVKVNSFLLITAGSAVTTVFLIIAYHDYREHGCLGLIAAGRYGTNFPTRLVWLSDDAEDCRNGHESGYNGFADSF